MTARLLRGLPMPRWAISFADLALLLLGCFVLLHALEAQRPKGGGTVSPTPAPTAPSPTLLAMPARDLFLPGEARLSEAGRAEMERLGMAAAGIDGAIHIDSRGLDAPGGRLDAFELAAARAAALARGLEAAGIAEARIVVTVAGGAGPQRLNVAPAPILAR